QLAQLQAKCGMAEQKADCEQKCGMAGNGPIPQSYEQKYETGNNKIHND
ncbi:25694_t:CDS:2, partial [Gigaspora margarita]